LVHNNSILSSSEGPAFGGTSMKTITSRLTSAILGCVFYAAFCRG
jgi:hypothetical protein